RCMLAQECVQSECPNVSPRVASCTKASAIRSGAGKNGEATSTAAICQMPSATASETRFQTPVLKPAKVPAEALGGFMATLDVAAILALSSRSPFPGLLGGPATIHDQRTARLEARRARRQEHEWSDQLLGFAETPERCRLG